jgi:hypothetical protein
MQTNIAKKHYRPILIYLPVKTNGVVKSNIIIFNDKYKWQPNATLDASCASSFGNHAAIQPPLISVTHKTHYADCDHICL